MTMSNPTISDQMTAVNIMLVSHTNVGKTTLIRTLLGQDVGEVLDAPDVTSAVTSYDLVVNTSGEALRLWDTPGFGDSFRLAKRLQQKCWWWAWVVREVWDRYKNPRLWRGQRVAMDMKERADVVLYLINSVERPVDAIYVAPEIEVLTWIGKPILTILNQFDNSKMSDKEIAAIDEWRNALAVIPAIERVLVLDSHTRCWIQELVLYNEIGHVLQPPQKTVYSRLSESAHVAHHQRFETSIATIANYLIETATDQVELASGSFHLIKDVWQHIRTKLPWRSSDESHPQELAMEDLAQRFMDTTKAVTDKLIEVNRLTGVSSGEIVETANESFSFDVPVDESASALAGGVISGTLAGLGADLLSGGMTLGSGALVGAVLGAVGAAALARGYNIYTDKDMRIIRWSPESLNDVFAKSVLLYLAIAHFGRGQGHWNRKDDPDHWRIVVRDSVNGCLDGLSKLWARTLLEGNTSQVRMECENALRHVIVNILYQLHPEARAQLQAIEFGECIRE